VKKRKAVREIEGGKATKRFRALAEKLLRKRAAVYRRLAK
jgi:hypothetical protein